MSIPPPPLPPFSQGGSFIVRFASSDRFPATYEHIAQLFTVVSEGAKIIDSGSLSAGDKGYCTVSINVPTGYKTTGIQGISYGHPGNSGGLQITGGFAPNATGQTTAYMNYYSPSAISHSSTDFVVYVLCIKSN